MTENHAILCERSDSVIAIAEKRCAVVCCSVIINVIHASTSLYRAMSDGSCPVSAIVTLLSFNVLRCCEGCHTMIHSMLVEPQQAEYHVSNAILFSSSGLTFAEQLNYNYCLVSNQSLHAFSNVV
jgi:hypothetical protein